MRSDVHLGGGQRATGCATDCGDNLIFGYIRPLPASAAFSQDDLYDTGRTVCTLRAAGRRLQAEGASAGGRACVPGVGETRGRKAEACSNSIYYIPILYIARSYKLYIHIAFR